MGEPAGLVTYVLVMRGVIQSHTSGWNPTSVAKRQKAGVHRGAPIASRQRLHVVEHPAMSGDLDRSVTWRGHLYSNSRARQRPARFWAEPKVYRLHSFTHPSSLPPARYASDRVPS